MLSIYFKLHCAVAALSSISTQNYANLKSINNMQLLRSCLTSGNGGGSSVENGDKRDMYMDVGAWNWHLFWKAR